MDQQTSSISGKALVYAAAFVSLGLFGAGAIKAYTDYRTFTTSQSSLSIPGYASRIVTSDRVKWSIRLVRMQQGAASSSQASLEPQLRADIDQIVRWLEEAGVRQPTVSRQPYQDSGSYGYDMPYGTTRTASQIVVIESDQVKELNQATGDIATALAARGVQIDQNTTEFFLSNRDQLRRELTQEAAEDARRQADTLSGGRIDRLTRIDSGVVLNVTPVNSYTPSYYGGNDDTTSLEKRVEVNLTMTYSLK